MYTQPIQIQVLFLVLKQGSQGALTSGQLFRTVPKHECTFSPDPRLVCTQTALDSTVPLPLPCLLLLSCAHASLVHYSQHTQQQTMKSVSTKFRTLYLRPFGFIQASHNSFSHLVMMLPPTLKADWPIYRCLGLIPGWLTSDKRAAFFVERLTSTCLMPKELCMSCM